MPARTRGRSKFDWRGRPFVWWIDGDKYLRIASSTLPMRLNGKLVRADQRAHDYKDPVTMAKKASTKSSDPVATFLATLSVPLVDELKKLIKTPQPEDTALLDFELHLSNELDIVASPMDAGAGQLGGSFLLKKSKRKVPKDFTDKDLDALVPAFMEWFAACWDKAGGATFPLRAYVFQHDSSKSFDLKQKIWVRDLEKWKH